MNFFIKLAIVFLGFVNNSFATTIEQNSMVLVNDFWNFSIKYKEEFNNQDIWQNPIETLELQSGDCEDYAIAKYFHLLALGYSESNLSLAWVKLKIKEQYISHLVLIVNHNGDEFVLDNYSVDIVKLNKRHDLSSVFVRYFSNKIDVNVIGNTEKIKENERKWISIYKNRYLFSNYILTHIKL